MKIQFKIIFLSSKTMILCSMKYSVIYKKSNASYLNQHFHKLNFFWIIQPLTNSFRKAKTHIFQKIRKCNAVYFYWIAVSVTFMVMHIIPLHRKRCINHPLKIRIFMLRFCFEKLRWQFDSVYHKYALKGFIL